MKPLPRVLVVDDDADMCAELVRTLTKRGYEVLLMTDPVDEWVTQSLVNFEGKPLVSAMRADLKIEENAEEKKARETETGEMKGLLDKVREVLSAEGKTTFTALTAKCETKIELIAMFLAVLELFKRGELTFSQRRLFSEIDIKVKEGEKSVA